MSQNLHVMVAEWKQTDAQARIAERRLRQAWTEFKDGRTVAIPDKLIQDVDQLRAKAHDRLAVVLSMMRGKSRTGNPHPR